jgi:hypothetical protein
VSNMQSTVWNPQQAWREFRLEAEALKHYHQSYALYIGHTHRDPLLDRSLPALLYIKAVAVFDDALALWLDANNHILNKPYKDDLNGRIRYLGDNSLLTGTDELHRIRRMRNSLAHEPRATCSWEEFTRDVEILESRLMDLSLVRRTPDLAYFAERSAIKESTEPGIAFERTFSFGVKENGKIALEVTWTEKTHQGSSAQSAGGRPVEEFGPTT